MRFDIGPGGAFAIMLGLAGLSGAVFTLGLVAGYEMGYQTQIETSQVATVYPVPPASTAPPAPSLSEGAATSAAAGSSAVSSASPKNESAARGAAPPSVKQAAGKAGPAGVPAAGVPRAGARAVASRPAAGEESGENAARGVAASREANSSATAPARAVTASKPPAEQEPEETEREAPAPVSKPYNIQIEAAMDRNGADNMAQRLRELGYQPTVVATDIGGQTWYRVKVGPYATEEEARQAQEELEAAYKARFTSH